MSHRHSPLEQAFLEDHQRLTRGLSALQEAVRNDDLPQALSVAEALDREAGAHMEFEEEVLYPQVALARGQDFVRRLYAEHQIGLEAVRRVLALRGQAAFSPAEKQEILAGIATAFDHVLSCGTLLTHVSSLDAVRQQAFLDRLLAYRVDHHPWSQIAENPAAQAGDPVVRPENA